MRPKSPVVSHPSASRTARVASWSKTTPPMPAPVGGPPQYPRMIAAECTRTRPTSPGTTGAPTSSVTSSDTPGTGRPTVVATASSGSPGTVPVPSDASVDVYRTATGTPNVARRDATNSGGTRDAPVPTIRRDDTSASASSGLASTRAHWVGTPCPTVIRSAAMIDTVSAARHGVGVMTVVMALAASSQTRVIDPTWANGRGDSRRSPGAESTSVPSATARRLSWLNTAPLGRPVVPLVHTTATGSDACRPGHDGGGGPEAARVQSARVTTVPTGPPGTGAPSSTMVTTGRVRSMTEVVSRGARRRLMPEVIAPRRTTAA